METILKVKPMKLIILIFTLFMLTSLHAIIITEQGYGSNEKDSLKDVLSDLSNIISSNVKSNFKTHIKQEHLATRYYG